MQRRQLLKGLFALPLFSLFKVAESRATHFVQCSSDANFTPVLPEEPKVTIPIDAIRVDDSSNIRGKRMNAVILDDYAKILPSLSRIESRPIEYSKGLERILRQNPLMTKQELAARLGKSYTWLCDRLSLLNIDEKHHKLVDEYHISLSNAYALAKIDKESQWAYINEAMTLTPIDFYTHAYGHRSFIRNHGAGVVDAKSVEDKTETTRRYFKMEDGEIKIFTVKMDYKEAKNLNFAKAYGSNVSKLQTLSPAREQRTARNVS